MRVTFVGSGGPTVTRDRVCPSILIDQDILIDCGAGAVRNLRVLDADLTAIQRILITHFHADHVGDLISLLWAMEMDRRDTPIEIAGYTGVEYLTQSLLRLMHFPEEFTTLKVTYRPLIGGEEFEGVTTHRTLHRPPNIAYRVTKDGRSVCYSGDTAYYEPLAKFAEGCNLLIHDALFLAGQETLAMLTNHSTAVEAARIAEKARVKTLALFHIFPLNRDREGEFINQARREFNGEILVARDLQTIEI
ncbi:MAG: MBL fold metallo-hydrolase [Candidatus Bathyarchaeia archaeon]